MSANAAMFLEAALALEDTPYLWGGKGLRMFTPEGIIEAPYFGLDCSGLVTYALKRVGGPDWLFTKNTDALWAELPAIATPKPGDVAFWRPRHPRDAMDVEHIEIVIGPGSSPGTFRTFGAAGGGRDTITLAIAQRQGAKARFRENHLLRPFFAGFRALPLTHGA